MIVTVLKEEGHEEALLGMALSYYDGSETIQAWWTDEKRDRAQKRAATLAFKHGGHNKFLESIQLWVYISAPRCFWSEFDTYRAGVTKQSNSTMHTLSKRVTKPSDYETGTTLDSIIAFNKLLRTKPDVTTLKMNLPEGFLQHRIVCTNYKALQNIVNQRQNHRLKQWPEFCALTKLQLQHPEYIWPDM